VKPLQRILVGSEPETAEDRQRRQDETVRRLSEECKVGSANIFFPVRKKGAVSALAAQQIIANGVWTWFTDPRARVIGDHLYTMAVDSAGTCKIHRTNLDSVITTTFSLSSTGLEVDDHNNGSINQLASGKLVAFYGKHNDDVFRYRVSTNAADISAWSAEQGRGTSQGPYSYPNPFRFPNSGDRIWLTYRQGGGGGAAPSLSYRTCDDIETIPATTWSSESDIYVNSGFTPYWKLSQSGNRLHVACTDRHPVQGQSSLYHFYLEIGSGGAMTAHASDGTDITASLPLNPSEITRVYDGSTTKCWLSDCAVGTDSNPHILWMKYPGNDGSAIEYWHARWTGSAWVTHKITDDGAGLYSPEVYYHGGLCFDSQDASRIFLSAPISGKRQIQEWRTTDSGATWSKHRDITTGSASGQRLRPFSPAGHDGRLSVLWFDGAYTTFTNYNTAIWGAG
jgi:hypothetical protein